METLFAPITEHDRVRIEHFMGMLGDGDLGRVLEIGSRDGRVTQVLLPRATQVVALDLERPRLDHPRVRCVQGDLTDLDFDDDSFDTVVCTEVLEHIPVPGLHRATAELARVVRGRLLVGVPFDQDIRLAATRCPHCGTVNPPWGHVNRFTRESLLAEFPDLDVLDVGYCGETRDVQPAASAFLEARLGYPNGAWKQEEPCIACGRTFERPAFSRRRELAAMVPRALNKLARTLARPRPIWIHVLLAPRA